MNGLLRQRGVATIELALILGLVLTLMSCTLLFGTVLWYVNVQQKTVHNIGRYLASVTPGEITNLAAATTAVNTAREMGNDSSASNQVGRSIERTPATLSCQPNIGSACGVQMPAGYTMQTPATIRVSQVIVLGDIAFFGDASGFFGGANDLTMLFDMTVPYVP